MSDPRRRFEAPELVRRPFDHYARYRLAAEVVEAVRGTRGHLRVLDVGGGPGSMAAFLPDDVVISTDLVVPVGWHDAAPDLVCADGAVLPFADAAFDVVVSLDTLEHVPPARREPLLGELQRVGRGWTLVVCPCATPGVADADEALLRYVRRRFGGGFPTVGILEEHLGFGHPDPDTVTAALAAGGVDVASLPSGRLDRWLPMMVAFFHLLALGDDPVVEGVQAWYSRLLWRDDLRAPAYRTAFLARAQPADGPPLDAVVAALLPEGPPVAVDASALLALQLALDSATAEIATELRARTADLERELDVVRADAAACRAIAVAAQERADAAEARAAVEGDRADQAAAHAAALEAFRDRVLQHPAARAARRVRDGLRGRVNRAAPRS